ncbi:MAG: TonB-dependent receptor [Bacteroidota bacterium]
MKDYYGMLKRLMLFFAFAAISNITFAQQSEITGRVTDAEDGSPIPGVNVTIKGTTSGTITDFEGNFKISTSSEDFLLFSYIGYETQEIAVGNNTNILVQLNASDVGLDEVVVIGYGKVKKGDATGAVTAIDSKDFNQGAITTAEELLVGKASGVVITSAGGQPGAGSTIRIRGGSSLRATNDPLIVIDGIAIDNEGIGGMANPLSTINPNDIKTFTVLKDASATAIYGSRASNGVIIITTKRGEKGEIKASYNGNVSLGMPAKYIEVLSADEFRSVIFDRISNHGLVPMAASVLGNTETDWQKEIYQNAVSHDHNVSVSGALKEVPFRVSFGYTDQDGILKNTNMSRSTFDVSVNPSLLDDNLKIDINAKGSYTSNDFSNEDAIGCAISNDPTQPIMNGNTRYGGYTAWTELSTEDPINGLPNNIATHNPVARLEYRDNKSLSERYILNSKIDYTLPFLPELTATANLGYDFYASNGHDNTNSLASWSYREPGNNVKNYSNLRKTTLLDFYLTYNKEIGSIHNLNVMGGYSYQDFYREEDNSNRPWEMTNGVYVGENDNSDPSHNRIISFFGRANYTLMDKYLLTATLRYDGSSRFSKENRWGLFPSFAAAWKINEESFMENIDIVSNLKLRLGYGVTGQQNISDNFYPYIPAYTISQTGAYYQMGDTFYPTQRPDAYDEYIKWEETTTQNIGLDFGLMNDRISGSVEYYERETTDLINEVPIPAGTNFSNYLITNVGSLENKGFEVELTLKAISKEDMSLEISGNFSYNENKITQLTLTDNPDYTGYATGGISGGVGNNVQQNSVGYPASTFFLFQQVYDANGMPVEGVYVDQTGNGGNVAGDELNKQYLQNPAPDYTVGLSSRFTYKNIDFSFSGRANIGNYVYNNNASSKALYQNIYNQSGYTSNILKDVEKTEFMTAQYWSDFYLENASFFRMDNINLGYSFDHIFSEKINGRVGFTVQNAFVVTKYTGLDPEVDGGIDDNIFPRPRTFMFGLNLNF